MRIDLLSAVPTPDIGRLVEDFVSTTPLFANNVRTNRPIHPSNATLQLLGEAALKNYPESLSDLRQMPGFDRLVDSWQLSAMSGTVHLSYFLMSLILGRPGLRNACWAHGKYSLDKCLRWLVLHGIHELGLLPYLSASFVEELQTDSVLLDGRYITPFQACVLVERPDTLLAFRGMSAERFDAFYASWLTDNGLKDYHLFWLLSPSEVEALLAKDPSGVCFGATRDESAALPSDVSFPPDQSSPPLIAPRGDSWAGASFRSYGADYPGALIDLTEEAAVAGLVGHKDWRIRIGEGVELLAPCQSIALPYSQKGSVFVQLKLQVPEISAPNSWIRVRVLDYPETVRYSLVVSAPTVAAGPLLIPLARRGLAQRLEIGFASRKRNGGPNFLAAVAQTGLVIRSFRLWRSIE